MHKKSEAETSLFTILSFFLLCTGGAPGLQLLEEVITLVVHKDESGEVFHLNLPYGFHTQFGVLYALNALDAAL